MDERHGTLPMQEIATVELPTRRATTRLGRWLAQGVIAGDLVVLTGGLGAGKTFLTRSVARAMGVGPEIRVTSPTFTLVHEYETVPRLVHADLYRVSDGSEVDQLLLREMRAHGAVLFVEWGEPYLRELGGGALLVKLEMSGPSRAATLVATGPRARQWSSRALPNKLMVRADDKQD
ncbi:MAG TPA: tRNA (adenosine(37)-N6)-threonylcarbamoyltransferase complex ATPase subunit type 1 TsaE [Polyangiaceae bacterium]|nr:tRNA (adenosine(37)-N6)-threonylcarbamoyltransferase complex ATPase subunit type 1 TsaE [Polyangiaceae bacterium]